MPSVSETSVGMLSIPMTLTTSPFAGCDLHALMRSLKKLNAPPAPAFTRWEQVVAALAEHKAMIAVRELRGP